MVLPVLPFLGIQIDLVLLSVRGILEVLVDQEYLVYLFLLGILERRVDRLVQANRVVLDVRSLLSYLGILAGQVVLVLLRRVLL